MLVNSACSLGADGVGGGPATSICIGPPLTFPQLRREKPRQLASEEVESRISPVLGELV